MVSNCESVNLSFLFRNNWFNYFNVVWDFLNWDVSNIIFNNRLNLLISNWNEVVTIDSNDSVDRSGLFGWLRFVSEYCSVNFWNCCNWNVSLVSYFKCVDLALDLWMDC